MKATQIDRVGIAERFRKLKEQRKIGFVPFVPAGYPDLQTTCAVIKALESAGADVVEIGFPFSDPIADGPTIQEAFSFALAKKLRVTDIFAAIKEVRQEVAVPIVAMVSFSIVFRYGLDRFLTDAKSAGFDGLILPDLPPPEAQRTCDKVRSAGLDTILLVATTTTPARRKEIARLSSGFVYYLSVSGITGARTSLPPDLAQNVLQLRELTDRPVCVGFGVSTPQHVEMLSAMADGAIVGSAIVRVMKQHENERPEAIAAAVGAFAGELLSVR